METWPPGHPDEAASVSVGEGAGGGARESAGDRHDVGGRLRRGEGGGQDGGRSGYAVGVVLSAAGDCSAMALRRRVLAALRPMAER